MTLDESSILGIIKLIAAFATVVFGVVGTLTESKDKEGRRTPWSNVALAGVVISGSLAILSQWLENDKNRQDAIAQQKSYQRLFDLGTKQLAQIIKEQDKIKKILAHSEENLKKTNGLVGAADQLQKSNVKLQQTTTSALNSSVAGLEKSDQTLTTATAVQRNSNQLLTDSERLLNPITNVSMSFWLAVPLRDPSLSGYRRRLADDVSAWLRTRDPNTAYESTSRGGITETISFGRSSPLWPRRDRDELALRLISGLGFLGVNVYKPALTASQLASRDRRLPDRVFSGDTSSVDLSSHTASVELEYDVKTEELLLRASGLTIPSRYSNRNNKVISLSDLRGSGLFVALSAGIGGPERLVPDLDRLSVAYDLHSIILNIDGQELWLRRSRMHTGIDSNYSVKKRWFYLEIPPDADPAQFLAAGR